jgi:transcriptional regulator with XRE-family HTH domain
LADAAQIPVTHLNGIERGKQDPTIGMLNAIAGALWSSTFPGSDHDVHQTGGTAASLKRRDLVCDAREIRQRPNNDSVRDGLR